MLLHQQLFNIFQVCHLVSLVSCWRVVGTSCASEFAIAKHFLRICNQQYRITLQSSKYYPF